MAGNNPIHTSCFTLFQEATKYNLKPISNKIGMPAHGKTKLKKLFSVLLVMLLFSPTAALAQSNESTSRQRIGQGTNPDSFWYFLDVALDNIRLAMTFNTDARILKELTIAKERLIEVRAMGQNGDVQAMTEAMMEHGKTLQKFSSDVREVENADSLEELRKELEIESLVKSHSRDVENVKDELKIVILSDGSITPEQQARIISVLSSLEGQTTEIKIRITNEKSKTKIGIEQETGRSGDEVEEELEDELGLGKGDREEALEEIAGVLKELKDLLDGAQRAGRASPEDLELLTGLVEQAEDAFEAGDFELIKDLVNRAKEVLEDQDSSVESANETIDVEEDTGDFTGEGGDYPLDEGGESPPEGPTGGDPEAIKQAAEQAGEAAKQVAEQETEAAKQAAELAGEAAKQAAEQQGTEADKQAVEQAVEAAKQAAEQAGEASKQAAEQASESAKQSAEQASESAGGSAEDSGGEDGEDSEDGP